MTEMKGRRISWLRFRGCIMGFSNFDAEKYDHDVVMVTGNKV